MIDNRLKFFKMLVLVKIDTTMTTINKKLKLIKPNFARSRSAAENPTLGT